MLGVWFTWCVAAPNTAQHVPWTLVREDSHSDVGALRHCFVVGFFVCTEDSKIKLTITLLLPELTIILS